METPADTFDLGFDPERSRAAVAVACLEWLRCTGPVAPRWPLSEFAEPGPKVAPIPARDPMDWPHPLWDDWLDG